MKRIHKIGIGIAIAVVVVMAIALAPSMRAGDSELAQGPAGQLQISQSSGRVLTLLRIAGGEPIPVVFDTGTSGNIIDRQLAARLGLPVLGASTAIDGSLGKPVPGFLTRIKGATLGTFSIDTCLANAIDYNLPNEKGIFGPNSFPGRLVEMDLAKGSILVEPKTADTSPPGTGISYIGEGDDALPAVIVDFGSIQVTAELDTGNNEALLFPLSLTNKLSLEEPLRKVGDETSAAGKQPLYRSRLHGTVKIGPLTLDRPNLLFIEGGKPNVGLPIARQLVVVFDPSGKRSWIIASRPRPNHNLLAATAIAFIASGGIVAGLIMQWKLRK